MTAEVPPVQATAPRLAFLHGPRGLREFIWIWGSAPPAWVEVDPGYLGRVSGYAYVVLARRDPGSTGATARGTEQWHADVRVLPGPVPTRIRVDLGRRFDGWRVQRGYRWAIVPDTRTAMVLVTRSGTPVSSHQIPDWWRTPVAALREGGPRVHVTWTPAVVYQSCAADWAQTVLDLARVEAFVLVAAGGEHIDCPAGHPFLWVGTSGRPGRRSRRWCPEHRREARTLAMRYSRHRQPEDLQALQRLGYDTTAITRLTKPPGRDGLSVLRRRKPGSTRPSPARTRRSNGR